MSSSQLQSSSGVQSNKLAPRSGRIYSIDMILGMKLMQESSKKDRDEFSNNNDVECTNTSKESEESEKLQDDTSRDADYVIDEGITIFSYKSDNFM